MDTGRDAAGKRRPFWIKLPTKNPVNFLAGFFHAARKRGSSGGGAVQRVRADQAHRDAFQCEILAGFDHDGFEVGVFGQ